MIKTVGFVNSDSIKASGLSLLDWDGLFKDLKSTLHFEKSKNDFLSFGPASAQDIEWSFDILEMYLRDYDLNYSFFDSEIRKVQPQKEFLPLLRALSKAKIYDIPELHYLATVIEAYLKSSRAFAHWKLIEAYAIDRNFLQKIERQFLRPLRDFVLEDGSVHYERHPKLMPIYQKVTKLEHELRSRIMGIARSPEYSISLELGEYDCIYDRYVLPIPTDSYKASLGPIVTRSSSGKTLYVEPPELREKSNERVQLLAQLEEILLSIGREFSVTLHPFSLEIERMMEFLFAFDLINAKAKYVIDKNLIRPKLSETFKISLEGFFHPMIPKPVKNDFALEAYHHGFVLSGPNTGGKTAAMKAIALCHLFIHMGLFVPATAAEIYPVKNLYYFSSDDQNLSEGLSSFSSEVNNYLRLLENLGESNLILIDEIFSSTSSEEASALAIALLREIGKRGDSKVLISTHHQVLKTFIHGDKEYMSARVGFDLEKGPTYKLYTDGPGSSMAFTIFENLEKKLGLETSIPSEAKKFLDKKQIAYEKLLQDLAEKKGELEKLLLENRKRENELKNQKKAMEGLISIEKEKRFSELRDEVDSMFKEGKRILDELKAGKIENLKGLDKQFSKLRSKVHQAKGDEETPSEHESARIPDLSEIKVGNIYFSTLLKKEVRIADINPSKKEVRVFHKNVSVTCPLHSLRYIGERRVKPEVKIHIQTSESGTIEINGRGLRLDEFEKIVDKGLLDLSSGAVPYLHVIHGHGDGILKRWLRDFLTKNTDFSWKPEDGNDGATLIELKR